MSRLTNDQCVQVHCVFVFVARRCSEKTWHAGADNPQRKGTQPSPGKGILINKNTKNKSQKMKRLWAQQLWFLYLCMFQREFRERIQQQKSAQNKLREQRQQVARAKKYYSIYHTQLRSRLMQAKTQEEQVSAESTTTTHAKYLKSNAVAELPSQKCSYLYIR